MTRHIWLRHPPRTIRPHQPCPNGTPYASEYLAAAALLHGLAVTGLKPAHCNGCGGWHNEAASGSQ